MTTLTHSDASILIIRIEAGLIICTFLPNKNVQQLRVSKREELMSYSVMLLDMILSDTSSEIDD